MFVSVLLSLIDFGNMCPHWEKVKCQMGQLQFWWFFLSLQSCGGFMLERVVLDFF